MQEFDGSTIWQEALDIARKQLPEQEFLMWFRLAYQSFENNTFIVGAPNSFLRDQFDRKYHDFILGIIKSLTELDLSLSVVATKPDPFSVAQYATPMAAAQALSPAGGAPRKDGQENGLPTVEESAPREGLEGGAAAGSTQGLRLDPQPVVHNQTHSIYIDTTNPVQPRGQAGQNEDAFRGRSSLRANYRFDNFIVGDNNRFTFNASEAVAKSPARVYNPLLIYGGVGLGKTHLMHAIGNSVGETYPSMKIICITAEDFTNEFIQTIHDRSTHEFKNKYRGADILLIDDIHFFQNKPGVQEELFHTFNALYDSERQMVFTLDRHVKELKDFSDRLKSRFDKGLVVDVQPPMYETRVAILKQKLLQSSKNVSVSEEVIDLIANNVSSNVRDLEGCLTKLTAYADLVHKELTVDIAKTLLKEMFNSKKHSVITVDSIIRMVADNYKLSLSDLKGKKRSKNIAFARQVAMFVIREVTEYSTTEIGVEFGGRDHTTVMHSCQKIEQMAKFDPSFDTEIQKLLASARQTETT